jgi:predicted  nucleic acid-binding Zn-ribbon protein
MRTLVINNVTSLNPQVHEYLSLRAIESYEIVNNTNNADEVLEAETCNVIVFDGYLDVSIIELLSEDFKSVNDVRVFCKSINAGRAYSNITQDIFVLPPDNSDTIINFWDSSVFTLRNSILCESFRHNLIVNHCKSGALVKANKLQMCYTLSESSVTYKNNNNQSVRIKIYQLLIESSISGDVIKSQSNVRHQPGTRNHLSALLDFYDMDNPNEYSGGLSTQVGKIAPVIPFSDEDSYKKSDTQYKETISKLLAEREAYSKKFSEMQSKYATLYGEYTTTTHRISDLNDEFDSYKKSKQESLNSDDKLKSSYFLIKRNYEALQMNISNIESDASKYKVLYETLTNELSTKEEQSKALLQEKSEIVSINSSLSLSNNEMTLKLSEIKRENDKLREDINSIAIEKNQLHDKLESGIQETQSELSLKLKASDSEKSKALSDLYEVQNKLLGAEDQLQLNEQTISSLNSKVTKLTALNDKLNLKYSEICTKFERLQEEFNVLSAGNIKDKKNYDTLLSAHEEIQKSYDSIKTNLDNLQQSYNSISSRYDKLLKRYNSLSDSFNEYQNTMRLPIEKDNTVTETSNASEPVEESEKFAGTIAPAETLSTESSEPVIPSGGNEILTDKEEISDSKVEGYIPIIPAPLIEKPVEVSKEIEESSEPNAITESTEEFNEPKKHLWDKFRPHKLESKGIPVINEAPVRVNNYIPYEPIDSSNLSGYSSCNHYDVNIANTPSQFFVQNKMLFESDFARVDTEIANRKKKGVKLSLNFLYPLVINEIGIISDEQYIYYITRFLHIGNIITYQVLSTSTLDFSIIDKSHCRALGLVMIKDKTSPDTMIFITGINARNIQGELQLKYGGAVTMRYTLDKYIDRVLLETKD